MNIFKRLLQSNIAVNLALTVLEAIAEKSTNKVDDLLVSGVKKAVSNQDSGLQRKPTGPRKNLAKKK